ncbi:MAG TPA: hypothetical protein VFG25_07865 [Nitrosopumilaceae archaeon]|nr:hypothetical protein [Nitrosopumilaceae archaeon]
MYKIIVLIAIIGLSFYNISNVFAQEQTPQLATFQETAQILIDKQITNNVTASITLQSTSNQEIRIPSELQQQILETKRVTAIILTSESQCVLGVFDESCIMINVERDPTVRGIVEIQEGAKEIGNSLIDSINEVFDTNAKFHSVYIHPSDEANQALDTSGVVSGKGTVSAVYTMPQEDSESMYSKISALLIPKVIRDSGGFYETALNLSSEESSAITFSIIPRENSFLYQLKLSAFYSGAENIDVISPLEFLKTESLQRSNYFANGFYPLNSILNVVILSSEPTNVNEVRAEIIPTQEIGGEKIPTDLSISGWVFDPESGNMIDGKYLFGQEFSVAKNDLLFSIGSASIVQGLELDESIIVIIIVIAAGSAAIFFFKGFKKKV